MNFWGNGKQLCDAYIEAEREKIRQEQERIRQEKERIEKIKREAELKRAEEEAQRLGKMDEYKKNKIAKIEETRKPKEFRTSDGRLAVVPFVNTEAVGIIGKKAQLEIEKIRMSREEKLHQ